MRRILTPSLVLAALIPLASSFTRLASADEPAKPWKALSDRCQKLSNEGNYEGALEACERAYELNPDPGLLVYTAQIQTALLHPVQARDALQRYLRSGPLEDANRQMAEGQLRHLETLIATLSVNTQIAGAEIRIDDQALDGSVLARGVPLMAGAHRVTLQANGATFSRFVVLRGGERTQIELPGSGSIALACAAPEARFFIDDQEVSAAQAARGLAQGAGSHRV
ncbi:MAG TPA: tetratricopeptide repeat protein, partial [Polyangiaceae bacterium]